MNTDQRTTERPNTPSTPDRQSGNQRGTGPRTPNTER